MQAIAAASRRLDLGQHTTTANRGSPAEDVEARRTEGGYYIDPWREVCGRCPTVDCVVPEGLLNAGGKRAMQLYASRGCPIYQARLWGWDTETALEGAEELGLLDE